MTLRTRILLPLLLTLAILGTAATAAVVEVGRERALAAARGDLAAAALDAGDEAADALDARIEGVALLAFVKAETDRAAGAPPEQAEAARGRLAEFLARASSGLFERVALVDPQGREVEAHAAGKPVPLRAGAPHAGLVGDLRGNPSRPLVRVAETQGSFATAAGLVDAAGDFAGAVVGEAPLAAVLPPAAVPGGPSVVLLDGALEPLASRGDAPPPRLPPDLVGGPEQDGARTAVVQGVLLATAPVRGTEPGAPTWWLLTAMPAHAATEAALLPVYLLGAALLGVAAVAAGVVALVLDHQLRPLERLARAVAMVGSGPPQERVPVEGAGELRAFAAAFNAMVDRLAEREAALEREFHSRAQDAKHATIGSLGATVAHEIKNPLTGMRLQTELLDKAADDAVQAGGAPEPLLQAVRRMAEVNHHGITRIEKVMASLSMLAKPRPTVEAVDVRAVAEASVALAGAALRRRGIVGVEVPRGLKVLATTDGLGQVLLNLLANAADAVPAQGGWIRVAAERRGDVVEVRVEDNGPGIPAEVMARLGEPFFTTKAHGTGLGLSISRRILQEAGGDLRFGNRPEGGARFVVELPAGPPEPPASAPGRGPRGAPPAPAPPPAHAGPRRPPTGHPERAG